MIVHSYKPGNRFFKDSHIYSLRNYSPRVLSLQLLCLIICMIMGLAAPAAALGEDLARQVLAEINLARSQPKTYAGYLREFRKKFRGKYYLMPGSSTRIQTSEGTAAVDEAIRYLARQKPLPPLNWSDGLAAAADELAEDQGRSGATGHADSQGRSPQERIERHGKWERIIAENIGYGPRDGRSMVMQLIIDDGVRDRGHRTNIFNKAFGAAGAACGTHPGFGSVCVIDFAGGFRE
jgi:uncharacterized protein YkwD